MSNTEPNYFSVLVNQLGFQAARAAISKFSPVSGPIRDYLHAELEKFPGERGSFLADPVFEASFGWERANQTMQQLSGNLLHSELVVSMDSCHEGLEEQRFDASWQPYAHQVQAWELLKKEPPQSIIVSSGTGSGKTECFMIPILDSLSRQLEVKKDLIGVQALLLYPLNALINSQRDRLRAWTKSYNGKIRFCLYNGDTEQTVKKPKQLESPEEVLSREYLRNAPPPILVTNSTMLEYMLVRQQDHPIIEKSQGQLRWIILDEAHTYVGSHAAEISLLLRRVLHAFGVAAKDVRFIATSATIGDANAEVGRVKLQQYLADIAGVETSRVFVVQGNRSVPELSPELTKQNLPLPPLNELQSQNPENLFSSLASNSTTRQIRKELSTGPKTLSEISKVALAKLNAKDISPKERSSTLDFLDLCRSARVADQIFLPMKIHLFHRTQKGMWACCSGQCPGRKDTSLDSPEWVFGKLFMEHREACDEVGCGSKAYELVFCETCGAEYLSVEEHISVDGSTLTTRNHDSDENDSDDEELIDESEEKAEDLNLTSMVVPRLLVDPSKVQLPVTLDPITGEMFSRARSAISVGMLPDDPEDNSFRCCRCKEQEKLEGSLFRPARTSAAFHLGISVPTLLLNSSPVQNNPQLHPFEGRRLITFSDSRQGTARFSLLAQLDSERNYVRSWLYHQVSASRPVLPTNDLVTIKATIASLEAAVRVLNDENLRGMLEKEKSKLNAAESPLPAILSWGKVIEALAGTCEIKEWLPLHWSHTSLHQFSATQIARLCLLREFARRPKRQTSLETLGLVGTHYPALDNLSEASLPAAWRQKQLGVDAWRDFLKISLDMFVRANAAVQVPEGFNRWIGTKIMPRFIVAPNTDPLPKWSIPWPTVSNSNPRSRLAILLFRVLNLSPEDSDDRAVVNELLRHAWNQVRPILTPYQGGFRLDFDQSAALKTLDDAWVCPVTRRVLDVTLMGISPYVSLKMNKAHAICQKIKIPALKYVFCRDEQGRVVPKKSYMDWLNSDPNITELRQIGVWSSFSDNIASFSNFFRIAEHSAQQGSKRLRGLESSFKKADINILSCSTTMEMGVDIGGIKTVAMNNAPPSPANYLQRSGRAGRRGESEAVSFTLCQAAPHGESVFNNPAWPFRTYISLPHVSLQSERIIQRHINALALTYFLLQFAGDVTKLQSSGFFLPLADDTQSYAEKMELWLQQRKERKNDQWLYTGVGRLIKRTALAGADVLLLLDQVARALNQIVMSWRDEYDAIMKELEMAGGEPQRGSASPAQMAIFKQLQRIRDEYLLGELASRGFLPGYGFPTAVVPFVNTTLEDLRKRAFRPGDTASQREDNRAQKGGYPQRDLPMAIRDYAPVINVNYFSRSTTTIIPVFQSA